MYAFIYSLVHLLHSVISIYIWIVIIAAVLSFVRPDPQNPIVQIIYKLTDPLYSFIREKMPFVVLSSVDLSPLVIILGLQFVDTLMMKLLLG